MTKHQTGSRQEWLAERLKLLEGGERASRGGATSWRASARSCRGFASTRSIDSRPMKETRSCRTCSAGARSSLVYHLMFGPDYTAACPSCSAIADGFNGIQIHLANHDVMLCAVSRAPLPKLQAYKRRLGWSFPWASSFGSEFNSDFSVGFSRDEQLRDGGIKYNYACESAWKPSAPGGSSFQDTYGTGVDMPTFLRERPGVSAFALEDGAVFHTYSTYARGLDGLWGMWQWLDRAPKGRNETGHWWRRHDEYGEA